MKIQVLFRINQFLCICLALVLSVYACKKDSKTSTTTPTPVQTGATGNIVLEFQAKVDASNLIFGTKYINAKGDTFTISKFNYFISNVVFTNTDNTVFSETESFHIVRHLSGSSFSITIPNVPVASYKSIAFTLGVDSTRNVSGVQSGELDPANSSDMYWGWNTGYIFMKLEGIAPNAGSSNKKFEYHIGGFGGVNKTQRNFSFSFGTENAVVKESASTRVLLNSNVNEIFTNPTKIDVKTQFNILSQGTNAKMIADNYADMISFDRIQNN